MKTKDNKVEPFTATYQTIDSDRGLVRLLYKMCLLKLRDKKNVSTKDVA